LSEHTNASVLSTTGIPRSSSEGRRRCTIDLYRMIRRWLFWGRLDSPGQPSSGDRSRSRTKVKEGRHSFDLMALLQQIGALSR
jgi:hypothetical protein